ncbi:carbohydrate kinase family protein [Nesterenkonia populi]|uniref:carbohydrate kinase family protein n=1 Tax=Nesterenkonia populi TaxID=1591087 RepID=UPI0011BDAFA4|nr:carbohydrate kinase [Nesterenkonia populi]
MSSYLAVIGECLVDVVHTETSAPMAHVGGSPFNVAVGLARLEHPVVFVGRRGSDDYGRMIARSLRSAGVTSLLGADSRPTSVASATLDPTGQPSYEFELDWTLPDAAALEERFAAQRRTRTHLHTGSIASMLEPGAETVKALLSDARETATISYDPNYRPTIVPNREQARRQAEEFIALSDVVQASTDDLEQLYPERTHADTMHAWLELGPSLVTVTRGGSGAMAVAASGIAEQPVFSVEVADTVGAGDSFMAATLSSLFRRGLLGAENREALRRIGLDELREVLRVSSQAAGLTSARFGAQLPTAAELTAALEAPQP